MDTFISDIIRNSFHQVQADRYFKASDLLLDYGYREHLEEFYALTGTSIIDDSEQVRDTIISILEEGLYNVLLTMFIVPANKEFDTVYELTLALYYVEQSLEHEAIMEKLNIHFEDQLDPKEVLVDLLESFTELTWEFLNENISEVRSTLIKLIGSLHSEHVEADVEYPDNIVEIPHRENILNFFKLYPNTITQAFIDEGVLQVPVDTGKSINVLSSSVMALQTNESIAIELLAISFIAPIKLRSVGVQAKKLANDLFSSIEQISDLTLCIDKIIRERDLLNEK